MSVEQTGTGFFFDQMDAGGGVMEERQEDGYRESQMQILARRDIL